MKRGRGHEKGAGSGAEELQCTRASPERTAAATSARCLSPLRSEHGMRRDNLTNQ